jgi:hypothetical protein
MFLHPVLHRSRKISRFSAMKKQHFSGTLHHRVNIPEYGMIWEFSGRNAIQGDFHFEA